MVVELPANTPNDAKIFVAGNFNNWQENNSDFELEKQPDGRYALEVVHRLDTLEFKICRGTWTSVEINNCGHFVVNHKMYLSKSDTIKLTVRGWEDLEPVDCPRVYLRLTTLPANTPAGSIV